MQNAPLGALKTNYGLFERGRFTQVLLFWISPLEIKMLVRLANREDPDQTGLSDVEKDAGVVSAQPSP